MKCSYICRAKLVELNKIKVGAVSYLNTKPLIYGVKRSAELLEKIELVEDFPAHIAEMLVNGTIDVGLVPVAIIPKLKEWHIVSDYCIGATEAVGSVCIFSEVPISKIKTVLLDYQSKTSVNLARILLKEYWKLDVEFVEADENYRDKIMGTTAGVVIGDRAFEQRHKSAYMYDLAEAWIDLTGLPFVFAAWVANKKLPTDFIDEFNKANAVGLNDIESVINSHPYTLYDLHTYFTKNISYTLDGEKQKGLEKFLDYLTKI
jgi:chorismate dehydratase